MQLSGLCSRVSGVGGAKRSLAAQPMSHEVTLVNRDVRVTLIRVVPSGMSSSLQHRVFFSAPSSTGCWREPLPLPLRQQQSLLA